MPERPHRAFELDVHIGADDWNELVRELDRIAAHVTEHGEKCSLVSGGSSVGAAVTITVRPEMTHDRYFEELDAYLETPHA